jgi:hypothetical protein
VVPLAVKYTILLVAVLVAFNKGIADAVGNDDFSDPDAVRRLHRGDVSVLATNLQGLLGGDEPEGTRLIEP